MEIVSIQYAENFERFEEFVGNRVWGEKKIRWVEEDRELDSSFSTHNKAKNFSQKQTQWR